MKKQLKKKEPDSNYNSSLKTAFIFYGKAKTDSLLFLQKTANNFVKDSKNGSNIFLLDPYNSIDKTNSELYSSIKIISSSDTFLPDLGTEFEQYILAPVSNLFHEINLSVFLKDINKYNIKDTSYSSVFFKNQAPGHLGLYILGRKTYDGIKDIPTKRNKDFKKDLVWYLEHSAYQSSSIIVNQKSSFNNDSLFRKKLNLSLQPLLRWVKWNFSPNLSSFSSFFSSAASSRFIFTILSILVLVVLPKISFNAGISGDEDKHHIHAEKVYNYFKTDGADSLALYDQKNKLHFYSQSFDLASYVIAKKLNIDKIYELRHVLNGFIAALMIITTAVFVRFLAGNFAGILSLFLLFFSPRFLGHAMNNSLDIPFAFGYIFTLYQIYRFLKRLPDFSFRHSFWIMFGIAFTSSIRIGGMVLIPYFLMFSGLYVILNKWPWKFLSASYLKFAGKGLLFITLISVLGYFLALLPWPYALQDPIKNPFNALDMMANITVALRVMFEGKIIWSDALPWYYIPKNMAISIPILIITGFFISFFVFLKKIRESSSFWLFMLIFAVIFPIGYIIYKESNVYGGWRHVLFVYPSFVALSAIAIDSMRKLIKKKNLRYVFTFLIFAAMTHPVIHIINNYPLQYIYFNELTGGVDKAYKKYETDYYLHSLKQATAWMQENLPEKAEGKKIKIISNAPAEIMKYYYKDNLDKISFPYTRYYDRGAYDWDYAIFYCNYIDPYHLRKNIYPPKNTIHEIKVDNVTVCVIVERKNRDDYEGIKLIRSGMQKRDYGKIISGIQKIERAIKYDKFNEICYLNLGRAYTMIQNYPKARQRLNTLLSFYPNYDKALNLLGYSYLSEGDAKKNMLLIDKGISILNKSINVNYKFVDGYHNLGLAYMLKNEDERALSFFNKTIELSPRYKQSYFMIANILDKRGDKEKAKQIIDYANSF